MESLSLAIRFIGTLLRVKGEQLLIKLGQQLNLRLSLAKSKRCVTEKINNKYNRQQQSFHSQGGDN